MEIGFHTIWFQYFVCLSTFFKRHSLNPSSHTTALGSTQPLTEMSNRHLTWEVKAAGAYG